MNSLKKLALPLATVAALVLPSTLPAAGQPPFDQVLVATRVVPVADLDLTTAEGNSTLQRRLHRAAREVCRNIAPPMPGAYLENARCYTRAIQQATQRLQAARERHATRLTASSDRAAER